MQTSRSFPLLVVISLAISISLGMSFVRYIINNRVTVFKDANTVPYSFSAKLNAAQNPSYE